MVRPEKVLSRSPTRTHRLSLCEAASQRGVLGPDVYIPFIGLYGAGRDGHALDDAVGFPSMIPISINAPGSPLVAVAYDIFFLVYLAPGDIPFSARRKPAASASPQAGCEYELAYLLRRHFEVCAHSLFVAADGDILVDILRIDGPAICQYEPVLPAVERISSFVRQIF